MKDTDYPPHKSSVGLNANLFTLLFYAAMIAVAWLSFSKYFAWVVPIVIFIIERNSKFVKFYAVQGFFVCLLRSVVAGLFSLLDGALTRSDVELAAMKTAEKDRILGARFFANDIDTIVGIAFMVVLAYLALMAYGCIQRELPGAGTIARKLSKMEEE